MSFGGLSSCPLWPGCLVNISLGATDEIGALLPWVCVIAGRRGLQQGSNPLSTQQPLSWQPHHSNCTTLCLEPGCGFHFLTVKNRNLNTDHKVLYSLGPTDAWAIPAAHPRSCYQYVSGLETLSSLCPSLPRAFAHALLDHSSLISLRRWVRRTHTEKKQHELRPNVGHSAWAWSCRWFG